MRIKAVRPWAVLALAFFSGCGGDLPGVDPPTPESEIVVRPPRALAKRPGSRVRPLEVKRFDPSLLKTR